MYTLYLSKGSSAISVQILLEEIGARYEIEEVSIADGDNAKPAYLAVNPKGRIPALLTPEGVLTENTAIIAYLAQAHASAGLMPDTAFAFAKAQALNAYIATTAHVAFAHLKRGARWADDPEAHTSMIEKVPDNIRECARIIEEHYIAGPWALGDEYSFCDPYLFLMQKWMQATGVDITEFPKLMAHRDLMLARPAVKAALARQ
ncbi:glutathione S-transferase family protein [Ahrensia marina]|uniref:Glutathione S-transferase n=1 Tax=Ahrensia marina TaxID=1514904 RepID=A0A0M9GLC3_9HYPH|nr:glutathione S-transferase family protein [Ahrensia marina]KPB00433.1 hypothetical protein SU32_13940 [Ahrensia marina]